MKTRAIRIENYGAPEVMQYAEVALPDPGPGEVRIKHTAIGLNFIDTYHRTGLYPPGCRAGWGAKRQGGRALGSASKESPSARGLFTPAVTRWMHTPSAGILRRHAGADSAGISDEEAASVLLKD
jgi:NADPH2:quinone reductase